MNINSLPNTAFFLKHKLRDALKSKHIAYWQMRRSEEFDDVFYVAAENYIAATRVALDWRQLANSLRLDLEDLG